MADDNVHITLTAETDQAVAAVRKLQAEMRALQKLALSFNTGLQKMTAGLNRGSQPADNFTKGQDAAMRGLRQRSTFETRMNRQRLAEERAVGTEQARQDRARRVAEDAALRQFRDRMNFQARMLRQQASMERDAERARASAIRETMRETRAADRRRADVRRSVSRGFSDGKDVAGRVTDAARSVSLLGTIGAGALAKLGSIGLEARSRIDTAEANLRMFGGQSRDQVNATRSGWLNRSAVEFGFRPADALNAFTETLKAGIPEIAAKDVTRSIMGASAGLDLNVPDTTKLVGRLSTLTQDPSKFDAGAIDRMLNGLAVVAKVTAADSRELVSSLRRGAGVLGSSKMSVQDLTAFTGVGISAGMQEGKAGTFMDFLVNDMVNARTARGQRGKDLSEGFRLLGLGSNASVSRQTAQDPTAVLLKMFERMARMSPEKAARAANLIGMREWRGEMLMMSKASPMLRQTIDAERDPKNAGHLKQARDERLGTLAGLRSQLTATFDLAWEAVGGGIEDIVREISTFFIDLGKYTDFDVIKAHVHTLIDGFVDGLNFKNITEVLQSAFGKPGSLDYSTLKSFFEFAQGFGRGVRQVIDTIKAVVTSFTGTNMSADALGNLSAKVLGFSFALVAIAPYVAVLGGLAAALGGFAQTVGTIVTTLRAAGLMGGTGAAAGGFLGAGAMATAGSLLGVAFLATVADKLGILKAPDMSKGWGRGIVEFLDPGIASRLYGDGKGETKNEAPAWGDPPARVQKQSANEDWRSLISPASFSTGADIATSVDRMGASVREMGAHFDRIALTSGGADLRAKVGDATASMGGGASSGGGRAAGFYKPDMQVPDWYGRSRGAPGGVGASDGSPVGAYRGAQTFAGLAPRISADLRKDLGLSKTDTAAILGNLGHESAGFTAFQESKPRGGRGGWGWAQWTGPRRRAFEAWTAARGLDPKSYEANYGFLRHELQTSHRGSLDALRSASGLEGKTVAFEKSFEGAATDAKHYDRRIRYARAAAGMPNGQAGVGDVADAVAGIKADGSRAASAVDIAGRFLGKDEHRNRGELSKFVGHDVAGDLNAWCARFVNASLRDAGVKGTGSAMANSFLAWGQKVDAEATKRGDVLVEHRNRGVNAGGGHVGLATGNTRRDRNGNLELEMVSGNHGDAVVKDWISASKVAVRRSADAAANAAVVSMKETAATARRAQDGGIERLGAPKGGKVDVGGGLSGVPLGQKPSTDDIVRSVPAGGGGRFNGGVGGAGSGRPVQGGPVTINVHGAGENPQELANKVQRKMTEDWNHRTHDLEPELT